jgi:hypothetical protein
MKKWLPYLIIIIILIAGVWYVSTHERTQPAREIGSSYKAVNPEPCVDFSTVSKAMLGINETDPEAMPDEANQFPYKRASGEPYVLYSSTKSVGYVIKPDNIDSVQQGFVDKTIPELLAMGLQRDQIQDSEQKIGFDSNNPDRAFITGLQKGEDRYVVIVDNITSGDHNIIKMSLHCGRVNQAWDEVYDKVIDSSDYESRLVIGPVNQSDDLYTLGVHNGYAGGGGVTEYWTFTNNTPRKIFTGQDFPPCEVFENNRVGKNLDCFDPKTGAQRKVSY